MTIFNIFLIQILWSRPNSLRKPWTMDKPQCWSLRLQTFRPALECRDQTKSNTPFARTFKLPKHDNLMCKNSNFMWIRFKCLQITFQAWQDHCWPSPPPQSPQPPPALPLTRPAFCLFRGDAVVSKLFPGFVRILISNSKAELPLF